MNIWETGLTSYCLIESPIGLSVIFHDASLKQPKAVAIFALYSTSDGVKFRDSFPVLF